MKVERRIGIWEPDSFWGARHRWTGVWSTLFVMLVLSSGCVTAKAKGDHALEQGEYDLALRYYEEALKEERRDPELFYRAAIAAQHQGAFAEAERYFSQSLRNGGDREVVIALAEFYVQTSNFIEAVRVYHYLLRFEENVQPVYNNIGTSLMYGGKYLDAESYLLIAQQMDPSDPIPYLNLGALYDHHIRNRPRATRFYECFLELNTADSPEARQVSTRLQEFELSGEADVSRVNLVCGEKFRPGVQPRHDLQTIFDLEFGPPEAQSVKDEEIIIERLDRSHREEGEKERQLDELRSRGGGLMEAGHFDRAAEVWIQIPEGDRTLEDEEALGQAYYRTGKFEEAAARFEVVLEARPSSGVVGRLLEIYTKLQREEARERLCERFQGWPDFEEALRSCDAEGSR